MSDSTDDPNSFLVANFSRLLNTMTFWTGCAIVLTIFIGQKLSQAIYNIFFHPLRNYPGPLTWRMSRWPWVLKLWRGDLPITLERIHDQYGDMVRIAPDELSIIHETAWRDIYGQRVGNTMPEFPKHQKVYVLQENMPRSISNADQQQHRMLRRGLAHGFSEKSMRDQEPIIQEYVNRLMDRLHEKCQEKRTDGNILETPLNLTSWYNWTTFDIIGDLSMGSSFHCLDNSDYHPWVKVVTGAIREATIAIGFRILDYNSLISLLLKLGMRKRRAHLRYITEQIDRRINTGAERADLVSGLVEKKASGEIDLETLHRTCSSLINAGSETTASLLCGVTYLLLKHPGTLEKITKEVRTAFSAETQITFTSVQRLSYMLACLNEALRMYPPVPVSLPRCVPAGGAVIAEQVIPEGTVVAVPQHAMYHSSRHWRSPYEFHPERFLQDPMFATDKLDTLQPFSMGPRDCLGRNLAYAKSRLILSRLIYNFDMKLADPCDNWIEGQKVYFLWRKPPLNVYLTPVHRPSP